MADELHITPEAAGFVERSLGASSGALDKFSGAELQLLFDVVTSPSGAMLHLSFVEIGMASGTTTQLLRQTMELCFEWDDVWIASSALDHEAADKSVVEAFVVSFLRAAPTEPVQAEQWSMAIVIRRLCETSLLTPQQIDRLAKHSLLVAEHLTHGLADWRASEQRRLEQAFEGVEDTTEGQAWNDADQTPLAYELTEFIAHPTDENWTALLALLDAAQGLAPLSARVALERLWRSDAASVTQIAELRAESSALSDAWDAILQRHHRLDLALGVIGLSPSLQPHVVAVLDADPSLSLASALQRLVPGDETAITLE